MATVPGGLPQDMAAAVTLAGVRRKGVPDGGLTLRTQEQAQIFNV